MEHVILFTMSGCAPCKVVKEWIKELNSEIISIYDCEDDALSYVEKYGIKSVPTTIVFDKNMNELRRSIGNFSGDKNNFFNFLKG